MFVKKRTFGPKTANVVPIRSFHWQLEALYGRRSALDNLIVSLEDYRRFRARRVDRSELKTA